MSAAVADFNATDLATRIEALTQHELNNLLFGRKLLDRAGTVRF